MAQGAAAVTQASPGPGGAGAHRQADEIEKPSMVISAIASSTAASYMAARYFRFRADM